MKYRTQFIAINLALLLLATASVRPVLAQHSHDHDSTSWKTGMLRLAGSVWAGDVRLQSGMYHVNHVVSGDKHWIVFTTVTLGAGYREGSMVEGQEVVRLECRVEPVMKSVGNTKVIFGRKENGERSIESIQIAAENVRHVLLSRSNN